MAVAGYLGFLIYAVPLWLATGVIILRIDVQHYKSSDMNKERKTALFVGWFNIALGLFVFVGGWLYEKLSY